MSTFEQVMEQQSTADLDPYRALLARAAAEDGSLDNVAVDLAVLCRKLNIGAATVEEDFSVVLRFVRLARQGTPERVAELDAAAIEAR
jgi:hypothetical protein